jgi:hypothetical protein
VEAVAVIAGVFVIASFAWTARVLWYAWSGEYELDQRLKAITK